MVRSDLPRISLRFLANYHLLAQLGLAFFLQSLLFGLGIVGFCVLIAAILVVYGVVKATGTWWAGSHRGSHTLQAGGGDMIDHEKFDS